MTGQLWTSEQSQNKTSYKEMKVTKLLTIPGKGLPGYQTLFSPG